MRERKELKNNIRISSNVTEQNMELINTLEDWKNQYGIITVEYIAELKEVYDFLNYLKMSTQSSRGEDRV